MITAEEKAARHRKLGMRLANSKRWGPLVEDIESDEIKANVAMVLQNQYKYMQMEGREPDQYLTETTKVYNVGNFDKYAFPVIRALYANLIANELVSVQPMAGPTSLVFHLDVRYGTTKGNQAADSVAIDSLSGIQNSEYYSSATVPEEVATIGSNNVGHTVAYTPVKPGTVRITAVVSAANCVFADNGAGGFYQLSGAAQTISTGTIDYGTGAIVLDLSNNITSATITYVYDNEVTDLVPQLDLNIVQSSVEAEERKLRGRYSLRAAQNMAALHGLDAEAEIVGFLTEFQKYEIDRQIINHLYLLASAGTVTWDRIPSTGVSYTEHKNTLVDALIKGSNQVFTATKRAIPNWLVAGVSVCDVIESLPTFVPIPGALATRGQTGPVKIGVLNNRWTVYKDPLFPTTKWLMGFKGDSFLDAGYVYAPFIPMYATPTVILDDFIARKGIATQYGTKAINPKFYSTGEVIN